MLCCITVVERMQVQNAELIHPSSRFCGSSRTSAVWQLGPLDGLWRRKYFSSTHESLPTRSLSTRSAQIPSTPNYNFPSPTFGWFLGQDHLLASMRTFAFPCTPPCLPVLMAGANLTMIPPRAVGNMKKYAVYWMAYVSYNRHCTMIYVAGMKYIWELWMKCILWK